jgi:AbrB family looped-hinge helix DNA binding protein
VLETRNPRQWYNLTDSYREVQAMETTRLSSKGQIVLPLSIRQKCKWQPGTQLTVEETENGVLLRAAKPFPPTNMEEFVAFLEKNKYRGKPKTLTEMDEAIAIGVRNRHARGRY